jgi:hypothetical protein
MTQTPHYKWFQKASRPHIVITSNWDTLAEQAAIKAGLTVHLGWPKNGTGDKKAGPLSSTELVVLKLHGSRRAITPARVRSWETRRSYGTGV